MDAAELYAFKHKQGKNAYGPITKAELAFMLHKGLMDRNAMVFPISAGLSYGRFLLKWIAQWQAESVRAESEAQLIVRVLHYLAVSPVMMIVQLCFCCSHCPRKTRKQPLRWRDVYLMVCHRCAISDKHHARKSMHTCRS